MLVGLLLSGGALGAESSQSLTLPRPAEAAESEHRFKAGSGAEWYIQLARTGARIRVRVLDENKQLIGSGDTFVGLRSFTITTQSDSGVAGITLNWGAAAETR